jgi:putative flippase GtrA
MIGVLNTAITVLVYNLLTFLGSYYIAANVIGYAVGTLNSYFWNKSWVFKTKEANSTLFIKFIVVNLITLLLNNITLYILVSQAGMNKTISQLAATAVGMVINFVLNKLWTFNIKGGN